MPIIHITDLFTPPGDPDDHFDLLTLFGSLGTEVAAVIIDHTVDHGVPGTAAVAKAAALYGLAAVPCAVGLHDPLASEADTATDRPVEQQAAVDLIISTLRKCPDHQMIFTLVGSMRDLAAAYNREPDLFHVKTARLMVNAGDSCGEVGPRDWNMALDLAAWKRILASGLPIDWFPCNPSKGRGILNNHVSYWSLPQNVMLSDCPAPVRAFFESEHISTSDPSIRHMWSTVSIMEAAKLSGRASSQTQSSTSYAMEPVIINLDDDGTARWSICVDDKSSHARLLTIQNPVAYSSDMFRFLKTCFNNIAFTR